MRGPTRVHYLDWSSMPSGWHYTRCGLRRPSVLPTSTSWPEVTCRSCRRGIRADVLEGRA